MGLSVSLKPNYARVTKMETNMDLDRVSLFNQDLPVGFHVNWWEGAPLQRFIEQAFWARFGDARANVKLCCHQSFAKGRQLWGDSAEFQGAAFLLHHRRAHLSAAQMGEVKCPEEFLIWVIQQELTLCCAQATPSSCWGGTLSMNNLLLSPEAEVPALAPPAWLASEGRGNFFTTAPWPASSASGLELRTATLPRDLAVVDLCELPGPKLLSCFAFQDGRCSLPGGDLQIYELPGALVHLRWEKSAGRWKVWASAAGVSVLLSTLETPDPQLVLRTSSENVDCLDLCFIPLPGPEPQRRNVSKAEDSVGVLGSPVETKV